MPCLKKNLNCFTLEHSAIQSKTFENVLRHCIRLNFSTDNHAFRGVNEFSFFSLFLIHLKRRNTLFDFKVQSQYTKRILHNCMIPQYTNYEYNASMPEVFSKFVNLTHTKIAFLLRNQGPNFQGLILMKNPLTKPAGYAY